MSGLSVSGSLFPLQPFLLPRLPSTPPPPGLLYAGLQAILASLQGLPKNTASFLLIGPIEISMYSSANTQLAYNAVGGTNGWIALTLTLPESTVYPTTATIEVLNYGKKLILANAQSLAGNDIFDIRFADPVTFIQMPMSKGDITVDFDGVRRLKRASELNVATSGEHTYSVTDSDEGY
jgi:hypothetical protein